MPPKSQLIEKRKQIVDAFIDAVLHVGLEKASMSEVANRIGLDRSTLHYYFKTRYELISAATEHIHTIYCESLKTEVDGLSHENIVDRLIEHIFGPKFHNHQMSILLDELSTAGNRDAAIQEKVTEIYLALEEAIAEVLIAAFPKRSARKCRDTAALLTMLAEGYTTAVSLGVGNTRRLLARQLAVSCVAALDQLP
ncbi:TetR/AcrR family transcriptional regulator [Burkholderia cenocepacia]|uniref:TetR/AcrR family transcriptional regulator n=1 Tax=Burkholderia cenocepacia TaxID=95486 RepID=UPI002ABE81D0|nr:TetR family transcriptional regulator [Burkholderia cenocepacia]